MPILVEYQILDVRDRRRLFAHAGRLWRGRRDRSCRCAIRAIKAAAPEVPQVGCFDTAFHRAQPPLAQQFALPRELTTQGIRRYGFHGLSYNHPNISFPYCSSWLPIALRAN